MTVAEAIAILNDRAHNGGTAWYSTDVGGKTYVYSDDPNGNLTEFEAIAVALRYVNGP